MALHLDQVLFMIFPFFFVCSANGSQPATSQTVHCAGRPSDKAWRVPNAPNSEDTVSAHITNPFYSNLLQVLHLQTVSLSGARIISKTILYKVTKFFYKVIHQKHFFCIRNNEVL